jgi:hypothetical protein
MPMLPLDMAQVSKERPRTMPQMMPAELVAAGEAIFGPRWMRPLARAIGRDPRSVRFWKKGERAIPDTAAERIRNLHQIGPVGVVVRSVVRRVLPKAGHWSAHRVAMEVLSDLAKAGLLDERGNA